MKKPLNDKDLNGRQAIIWGRFSSDQQSKGESKERQERLNRALAKREGIQVIAEYFDEASSAKDGPTKLFQKVRASLPPGVGIICENLDRITRNHPWMARGEIASILNDGHWILTSESKNQKLYTSENIKEIETVLVADIQTMLAYEENQKRRKRIMEAQQSSIESVKKGIPAPLGGWLPAHIRFNHETRQYEIKEDKKAIYERIFREYANGKSIGQIAKDLNREDAPTLRGKGNSIWYETTIRTILEYEGVIGVLNLGGERIPNAFPPAIGEDLFFQVQRMLSLRTKRHGNYTSENVINLFKGFLFCSHCGHSIRVSGNTRYAQCDGYCRSRNKQKDKRTCQIRNTLFYPPFESDLLNWLIPNAQDALLGKNSAYERIGVLTAKKNALEERIEQTMTLLDEGLPVDKVKQRLRNLESERKQVEKDLLSAQAECSNNETLPEVLSQLDALLRESAHNPEVRNKIASALPHIIKEMRMDLSERKNAKMEIHLVNGETIKWQYVRERKIKGLGEARFDGFFPDDEKDIETMKRGIMAKQMAKAS